MLVARYHSNQNNVYGAVGEIELFLLNSEKDKGIRHFNSRNCVQKCLQWHSAFTGGKPNSNCIRWSSVVSAL